MSSDRMSRARRSTVLGLQETALAMAQRIKTEQMVIENHKKRQIEMTNQIKVKPLSKTLK
jgi:hypothetical protein